jgi:hypothetical protein
MEMLHLYNPLADCFLRHKCVPCVTISVVLYCIYSAFKTSMRRIQNIVNIQHTDNNKYIKFKVLNTIIKIKLKI